MVLGIQRGRLVILVYSPLLTVKLVPNKIGGRREVAALTSFNFLCEGFDQ
jgi:hypothetical protein